VKNPLAILQMGVNYLGKKIPTDDQNVTMVLQEMREAITRADTITRGLLDFSASKQLTTQRENLNEVIEATLKMVRHALTSSRIEVVRELVPSLPQVMIDRQQFQQVFVNIFMNAIHAMPDGGTLTVRTFPKQMTETTHFEGSRSSTHLWMGDDVVVAEVDDTGTGIPDTNLAKIFDPFFTTKPTGVGTGLGLPVTKKIIELHGGAITVRNRTNGGVRVTITLKQTKEAT
jgi:signal transduction histidine kinase